MISYCTGLHITQCWIGVIFLKHLIWMEINSSQFMEQSDTIQMSQKIASYFPIKLDWHWLILWSVSCHNVSTTAYISACQRFNQHGKWHDWHKLILSLHLQTHNLILTDNYVITFKVLIKTELIYPECQDESRQHINSFLVMILYWTTQWGNHTVAINWLQLMRWQSVVGPSWVVGVCPSLYGKVQWNKLHSGPNS